MLCVVDVRTCFTICLCAMQLHTYTGVHRVVHVHVHVHYSYATCRVLVHIPSIDVCVWSVYSAVHNIQMHVIVVDNSSVYSLFWYRAIIYMYLVIL